MLRALTVLSGLALLAPASALAAPFGEPSFLPVSGAATCLRATGAPGELVRATSKGAEFLQVDPPGVRPVAALALERYTDACPAAAARAGGAGIVAAIVDGQASDVHRIATAVREPGGGWGPVNFTETPSSALSDPGVGVSDRGDAVVAYATAVEDVVHIQAIRRTPGGPFEPAEELFVRTGVASSVKVRAGMTAAGEAVVAWSFASRTSALRELWVSIAAPGAAFAAPVRVGELRHGLPFALAVGADGRMLLAFVTGDEIRVAERPPQGAFATATAAEAADPLGSFPTAAVGADGAVVAWQRLYTGRVDAIVRSGHGAFAAPRVVARRRANIAGQPLMPFSFLAFAGDATSNFTSSGGGADREAGFPRAEIVPGGRVLLTWSDAVSRDAVDWRAPRSATIPLSGAAADVRTHGAELRHAVSVTPVVLANGATAAAWTDNHADRDGRVHAAVEGVADAADPAAPRLRVGSPSKRTLGVSQKFSLPVTCSAACDVRAQIGGGTGAGDEVSLRRAGTGSLEFEPANRRLVGPRGGQVRVKLRYGAPGVKRAAARTVTLRFRARPLPPVPRVIGAVARRDGDDVVVSWRTDSNSEDFLVFVSASTDPEVAALGAIGVDRKAQRFRLRFRDVAGARYATVFAVAEGPGNWKLTRVRVRG